MALKQFKDLYAIDIAQHVKKKPTFFKEVKNGKSQFVKTPEDKWLDYLEWSTVITLLYEHGAECVRYGCENNSNGYPAFYDNQGKNPFVRVWVRVDDEQFHLDYPVVDGSNAKEYPNQSAIHYAQQRAFVKCVAINTGLGLKLWQKDEHNYNDQPPAPTTPPKQKKPYNHDANFRSAVDFLKGGGNVDVLRNNYEITEEEIEIIMDAAL